MLKKYLNCGNAASLFINFALLIIMFYAISLTLYLSMPPSDIHISMVAEKGELFLENIFCALMVSVVFYLIMKFEFEKTGR